MIRGYVREVGRARRPFVSATLEFPDISERSFGVRFLIDAGADRTILSPLDAARFGIDLAILPLDSPSRGVGGQAATRSISSTMGLGDFSIPLTLRIIDSTDPTPSLLGRNVLSKPWAVYREKGLVESYC